MERIRDCVVAGALMLSIGCGRPEIRPAEPATVASPVERGAVGDRDLRALVAELASAKACELIRGQFRPLRAEDRPDVVIGVLWIRGCKISNVGTRVTLELSGSGWQWAAQQSRKAGGTFAIQQYVKFNMTATIPGALDVAYDPNDHIMSVWFTPAQPPKVSFTPIGGLAVDAKGAWSWVVGAIGTVLAQSPEHQAKAQATDQGRHELGHQLADGLSVTVNLCTGLSRFGLGRQPKGAMDKPDAGETTRVSIELEPGGLMAFGPQLVGDAGFTAHVESPTGLVRIELACRDQIEALVAAYVDGRPLPEINLLASKDIRGTGSLHVAKASCQVSLLARPLEPSTGAFTFEWQRPLAETATSLGGPLLACASARK